MTAMEPPRSLRGRRARALWREIAPQAAASGRLSTITAPLLATLCISVAAIESDPRAAQQADIRRVTELGRLFGIVPA